MFEDVLSDNGALTGGKVIVVIAAPLLTLLQSEVCSLYGDRTESKGTAARDTECVSRLSNPGNQVIRPNTRGQFRRRLRSPIRKTAQ